MKFVEYNGTNNFKKLCNTILITLIGTCMSNKFSNLNKGLL